MSIRKPYNDVIGYVASLKAKTGGHVVIYDRQKGFDPGGDSRYIVCMEPGGGMIGETSMPKARATMKYLAGCTTVSDCNAYFDGVKEENDNADN